MFLIAKYSAFFENLTKEDNKSMVNKKLIDRRITKEFESVEAELRRHSKMLKIETDSVSDMDSELEIKADIHTDFNINPKKKSLFYKKK